MVTAPWSMTFLSAGNSNDTPRYPDIYGSNASSRRGNVSPFARVRPQSTSLDWYLIDLLCYSGQTMTAEHLDMCSCTVMNPGLFWGQMIAVYGCGGALTLPWPARSPDLSPVEQVWDQLKRQMPSCHPVHDLELAVQDLWAHLPQDNIRCLINSMPDRVVACIAAGGGPTRY
ncbi:transposable element Tcb2 transposase [Trichonephila clavipes]|nr:transposable element Tcb2 transposase [Trichonephila clavipes]